jgi:hypothetical protein
MREVSRLVAIIIVLGGMVMLVPVGVGQEQQPQTPEQQAPEQQTPAKEEQGETGDQGRTRTYTSGTEETRSEAGLSFGGSVFNNRRNQFGLSLSAYESYAHDSYPGQNYQNSLMITSFYPRIFSNFGRRRSRLHLGAGFGYGFDNRDVSRDQQEYSADASYTFQATRKTSLQISDSFFLSPNYYGSILQPIIGQGPVYPPSYLSPTYRVGQRQLWNTLYGSINRQLGKKASIGLYSSYGIYQYGSSSIYNGDAVSVGISFGYSPTKWLNISSGYSWYLNQVNAQFGDSTVASINPGELQFRLSRSWRFSASGGVQIGESHAQFYTGATASARLSRSSRNNTLSISYYRGFSTAFGLSGLYESNSAQVDFGQRVARRISFLTGASYWTNSGVNVSGGYDFWRVRAGLEFLLRPDLVANVQYAYQYQTSSLAADSGIVGLNRNLVYFGIQYMWPGARR